VFAGRDRELQVLTRALDRARQGATGVVVISGEAGVGKTRLVREFAARATPDVRVVVGRCLDQTDEMLSFTPFVGITRDLVRAFGSQQIADVIPAGVADLASLVPTLDVRRAGDRDVSRGRLFASVLALLDFTSGQIPLVVVLEDIHWADPGSRDLLQYLTSNLESSRILFVVTHRPPPLAQAQQLPGFVSRLARSAPCDVIELDRLDRSATAEQVEGITGQRPSRQQITELFARSGGLPLFTESLVGADGTLRQHVPGHLTELLLQGVRELPDDCQQVLQAVAVAGVRVAHSLACAVTGLSDCELARSIRPAAETSVIVADGYGYAFRHDLIRRAVRDYLMLEGERVALHRAFALALEADPSLADGSPLQGRIRAAQHWRAAYERTQAFDAAWSAAEAAVREHAYTAEVRMLTQVLELWPRVPDARRRLGVDRVDLLMRSADAACTAAEPEQGLAYVEAGLELVNDDGSATKRAYLLMQRASMRNQSMLPGVIIDLREALRAAPDTSPLQHEIQAQLARTLWRHGQVEEAKEVINLVVQWAGPDPEGLMKLEGEVTKALVTGAHDENTIATLTTAQARLAGVGWLEGLPARTMCEVLLRTGQYERATEQSRANLAMVDRVGLASFVGPAISDCISTAERLRGRPVAALEAAHDALLEGLPPEARARLLVSAAACELDLDDLDSAETSIAETEALIAGLDPERAVLLGHLRNHIELARARGFTREAAAHAEQLIASLAECPGDTHKAGMLAYASRALADTGVRAPHHSDIAPDPRSDGDPLARLEQQWASLERDRAIGTDSPEEWSTLAEGWRAVERVPDAVYALCRAAQAAGREDRDRAESHLIRAVETRGNLTLPALQRLIAALGRQLHVRAASPKVDGAPFGLTDREVEVLKLVAAGRTNAEIATSLFISVKTASVHVSNILRKMKVGNRAAAAARAHQHHLADPRLVADQTSDG
jgi:DNA-binding CsgD family transcriptional regulator